MFVPAVPAVVEVALNEQCARATNPNVPLTARECAADAIAVADAGAAVVHFHIRDPETGRDVMDTGAYGEALRLIQAARPDLLVRTPYHDDAAAEARFAHVEELAADPRARLRAAMIDPGTVTFSFVDATSAAIVGDHTFTVPNDHFRHYLALCERLDLQSGIVVREPGHVRLVIAAHRAGWMRGRVLLQIHLSDHALWGLPPSEEAYRAYLGLVPDDIPFTWMSYTNGPSHWAMTEVALRAGAHVRVGIGDTARTDDGGTPTNVELVERAIARAALHGRRPATPSEALELLGTSGVTRTTSVDAGHLP